MSIVALKRKYQAKQSLSTIEGFSLKGTHRNIKNIGQNTQINSAVRTIFKGVAPTGHGALKLPNNFNKCASILCNRYPLEILCNKTPIGCHSVPTSTMTTKGLLLSKVYHPTHSSQDYLGQSGCNKVRRCSRNWVKSFNALENSQSMYIKKIKVKAAAVAAEAARICKKKFAIENLSTSTSGSSCRIKDCDNTYLLGTRKINRNNVVDVSTSGAMPASEYINIQLPMNNCLPTPDCKQPYPVASNKSFCQYDIKSAEEAKKLGVLPKNWMKCKTKYPVPSVFSINPYI